MFTSIMSYLKTNKQLRKELSVLSMQSRALQACFKFKDDAPKLIQGHIDPDHMNFVIEHSALGLFAAQCTQLLKHAKNYIEFQITDPATKKTYVATIRHLDGQTPTQQLEKLRTKYEALRTTIQVQLSKLTAKCRWAIDYISSANYPERCKEAKEAFEVAWDKAAEALDDVINSKE
jgi:hypothetical protein